MVYAQSTYDIAFVWKWGMPHEAIKEDRST